MGHRETDYGRVAVILVVFAVVCSLLGGFFWVCGATNPYTPAGYVGYLTQGSIMGSARFVGLQAGPVSAGRTWLLDVVNVSVTPYTYNESFAGKDAVLSRDNLRIEFKAHIVWKVRPSKVRDFVERYSSLESGQKAGQIEKVAYMNFLREPFRTFVRDKVQSLNGLDLKDNISLIGREIFKKTVALTKDTPFEIISTVVGNIQYPEEVSKAVSTKLATTQLLEQKRYEIDIEKQEREKRIIQAEGIAKAMAIINQKLSPQYLQHEAIEAQKAMVNSPNHSTIYIPVGPMGVPMAGVFDVQGK